MYHPPLPTYLSCIVPGRAPVFLRAGKHKCGILLEEQLEHCMIAGLEREEEGVIILQGSMVMVGDVDVRGRNMEHRHACMGEGGSYTKGVAHAV